MRVIINHVACDWLTLGTWNYAALLELNAWAIDGLTIHKTRTGFCPPGMGQYRGNWYDTDSGHYFFGSGEQDGQVHHIITAGGATADDLLQICCAMPGIAEHFRCTRIDIQRTLPRPPGWSQFDLLAKIRENHLGRLDESNDRHHGRLATVYVGSMKSARFARVYEKVVRDEVWLRCEVQFNKLGGAMNLYERMTRQEDGGEWLRQYGLAGAYQGFLANVRHEGLRNLFETDVPPDLPRVWKGTNRTAEWLLNNVLPSFVRTISQHDADGTAHEVLRRFEAAIDNQRKRGAQ